MDTSSLNQSLIANIQDSPTPFHAVACMKRLLLDHGFNPLNESDQWNLNTGRYFTTRNDSSLIAFEVGIDGCKESGITMGGAHTDSPCLKVKPNPVISKQGYMQLGVEVYGGVLLNPWFDRDLSLAGRVTYRNNQGDIKSVLIDFQGCVAIIPSLAFHLDITANSERKINAQTDIVPVMMQAQKGNETNFTALLMKQMQAEHEGIEIDKVLDYELSFYDIQAPALTGLQNDFISSARLDNLLSCYVGLQALLDSEPGTSKLLVCNDHEEVGSASSSGAQGPFLKSVLERIAGSAENLTRLIDQSMMISCDNAHGIHPNYSDKHDGNHGPILNQGPVIKTNANQRYASNSETSARFRHLCEQENVPVQDFVTRSDMGCGSTIGPITATEIGVKTVDVGVPQFAMHSIRETCGSKDPYYLYKVLKAFYSDQQYSSHSDCSV